MERQKGFTLIEAAVGIGVVAILSGAIAPLVLKNLADAKVARATSDVKMIAAAMTAQMKDTGGRPTRYAVAGNPGVPNEAVGATGHGQAVWASDPSAPPLQGVGIGPVDQNGEGPLAPIPLVQANALAHVLALPNAEGNLLFGLPGGGASRQYGYQGPYLASGMAAKVDPWGRAYIVLGYNENGRTYDGPIWVVCAGPSGQINLANTNLVPPLNPPAGPAPGNVVYPSTWNYTGGSSGNIAMQIN